MCPSLIHEWKVLHSLWKLLKIIWKLNCGVFWQKYQKKILFGFGFIWSVCGKRMGKEFNRFSVEKLQELPTFSEKQSWQRTENSNLFLEKLVTFVLCRVLLFCACLKILIEATNFYYNWKSRFLLTNEKIYKEWNVDWTLHCWKQEIYEDLSRSLVLFVLISFCLAINGVKHYSTSVQTYY